MYSKYTEDENIIWSGGSPVIGLSDNRGFFVKSSNEKFLNYL